jgi:hypothetical protein
MESFLENPNGVECGYECDDSLADDMVSQVEAMFGRYASKSIDSTGHTNIFTHVSLGQVVILLICRMENLA